ncbi:MAG: cytochrome b/b6 domain-containing protein [Candidatus Eisenbacteria bacterium]|nr:cytochrome b/b6 domain-containing protein [Candidatus Eisenbacteria bacterium]
MSWGLIAFITVVAATQPGISQAPATHASATIHPTYPLLDDQGRSVLESSGPVSPIATCGACHDTRFIETHSAHADAGFSALGTPGSAPSGRAWDTSTGIFGRWYPLTYRYLSPLSDSIIDLSTADWIRFYGRRHVGGGPAVYTRDRGRLVDLDASGGSDAETTAYDPVSQRRVSWEWRRSGVVELNCFLCHIANPDNAARIAELEAGAFGWASTATLSTTGLVSKHPSGWRWNPAGFDAQGHVRTELLSVRESTNDNCALCHGLVHGEPDVPVLLKGCVPDYWTTMTTGQIISPQRVAESGMNIRGKTTLTRAWDVHAERLVDCVDCHYSRNNPVYWDARDPGRPAHLRFEARRMSLGAYLHRPSHRLANSPSDPVGEGAASFEGCTGCHDARRAHRDLPYAARHEQVLACNACHVPRLFAPAREMLDWTVLTPDRKPRTVCRGVSSPFADASVLVEGYEPVLLPARQSDGRERLAPHNLVGTWFWVAGAPERPVRLDDLSAAYFDGDGYHPDIVALLDGNRDGAVDPGELVLDSAAKIERISSRLRALGLQDPRIVAELQPFAIHHGVAAKGWATEDCAACHHPQSRIDRPFTVGRGTPGDVRPMLAGGTGVRLAGQVRAEDGRIDYRPRSTAAGLYVLGHDSHPLSDAVGVIAVAGVLFGVAGHGALRLRVARKMPRHHGIARAVYMYTAYERFWHWLQALTIIALIVTGLEIHLPGTVRLLGFRAAVRTHTIVAAVVVVNAFLALFHHLAGGQIRQYFPEPHGFFDQAIRQARYYLIGIFRHEPHPFVKIPERKLNPLQQITYLALLNILLPLQIATGILMWGAERWPVVDGMLGGLRTLAPIHAVGAWLFLAFLIAHIYLTTTGHTVLSNIKAMLTGWENIDDVA